MTTQQQVIDAFYRLYQAYYNKSFTKSLNFRNKKERELLPFVRNYLLGYFDTLEPEALIDVSKSYRGRFDFIIDNIAVEFVVRSVNQTGDTILKAKKNLTEIQKLIRHPKHSLLILFDFKGNKTYKEVLSILSEYREIPSLGKGNYHRYPFTVVYFYKNEEEYLCYEPRRIRVTKRPISLMNDSDTINQLRLINKSNLRALEYTLNTDEVIEDYPVQVIIKDKELTIEYQDYEGNYYQYKGSKIESDKYQLISSQAPQNYASVSLFIDEENTLTIEGTLFEDGQQKEWLIEDSK